jgi:DNA-binding IclR family transcriptional regulator
MAKWRFLTNHALVLIHVANNPRTTLREISNSVGITERAALSILRSMEEERIISRQREGRKNRYWVDFQALLDHQLWGPYSVVELASTLTELAQRLQHPAERTDGQVAAEAV